MRRPEASGPERTPYGPARLRLYLNGEATMRVRPKARRAYSSQKTHSHDVEPVSLGGNLVRGARKLT